MSFCAIEERSDIIYYQIIKDPVYQLPKDVFVLVIEINIILTLKILELEPRNFINLRHVS